MDRFPEMTTFLTVVDAGSLSAASQKLGRRGERETR
jgi:hypothetical protein